MKVVSVDYGRHALNNERVTNDERQQIGLALRALRVRKGLDQIDVAKKVRLSVGTVQAIEGAWYEVKDSNVEKVAGFFKTSIRKLLEPDEIKPTDPLLAGLNREDLQVARLYHDATTTMRQRVHGLLRDGENEQVTSISSRLERLSSEDVVAIESMITKLEAVHGSVADKKPAKS